MMFFRMRFFFSVKDIQDDVGEILEFEIILEVKKQKCRKFVDYVVEGKNVKLINELNNNLEVMYQKDSGDRGKEYL